MLHLAAFLYPTGYHVGAWRLPDVEPHSGFDPGFYLRMAKLAEDAAFDFVFLADSLAMRGDDPNILSQSAIRYVAQLEPLTLISAIAAATSRIGLVASASTTYNQPFHVARAFASLDLISGGRAGWNLVTSQNKWEAENFGLDRHPDHAVRYDRAAEFAQVVTALWDSWAPDAFINDREGGRYFDPDGLRVADHHGRHFDVRGPLHVPRSPQGRPIILQAGASEPGLALAGRVADVVFTAQDNLEDARAFRREVRARAAAEGRDPDTVRVMPGIMPIVAESPTAAQARFEQLQALVEPEVGLSLLEGQLGEIDLSKLPLDAPLPEILPSANASKSRQSLLLQMAQRERMSLRDLYLHVASSRGHKLFVGSAVGAVDLMEHWYREGAADGFNVMPAALPEGLESFVRLCVPELRARRLCRTAYEATTLRGHLRLPAPDA